MGRHKYSFRTFILLFLFSSTMIADTVFVKMKNGKTFEFDSNKIERIYFDNSKQFILDYKKFGKYIILKSLSGYSQEISFQIKPTNSNNQVWFGGFCGPDGRGGIGLFVWGGKIKLNMGNSCNKRYPSQYISLELPFGIIDLNKWNDIKIKYISGKIASVTINGLEKKTTSGVPLRVSQNKVFIGTDPRHPGNNYNFHGEIRQLNY